MMNFNMKDMYVDFDKRAWVQGLSEEQFIEAWTLQAENNEEQS